MALLKPNELDSKIRNKLFSFLKKKYKVYVHKNYSVYNNFAPDYYLKQKNGKKTIVIYRNPPEFPNVQSEDIRTALKEGISVYIAIFNHDYNPLLDELINKCDTIYGAGVLQISNSFDCVVLQPALLDVPKSDNIIENRIKIFISSKLWIPERDITRNVLKKVKYQPICVERIPGEKTIQENCFKWIEKSQFFIAIVTRQYRQMVDKEIKHALKKKKKEKCLFYIKNDCFQEKKLKLKNLIKFIQKEATFHKFVNETELRKMQPKQIAELIGKNTK
ncbi:MAG: DUF4062 domain-containing protein [Nanoarchaeota archaeon]